MKTTGVDIGGANIKLADGSGYSQHFPFALWQKPEQLTRVLQRLLNQAPAADQVSLTMTGELTDCFATKQEGVEYIIDSTCAATNLPVVVYLLDGRIVDSVEARQSYMQAAASNWHALASYLAQFPEFINGNGLLIDIGSTTSDIIPFANGRCIARGQSDQQRLIHRELVYTGVVRSPVCGIVNQLDVGGQQCPVMNELFATSLDAHILLGNLPPGTCPEYAADQTGTQTDDCHKRIARLVGLDHSMLGLPEARCLARQIAQAQIRMLTAAVTHVIANSGHPGHIVFSGQGEFLANQVISGLPPHQSPGDTTSPQVWSFSQWFDSSVSSCATAHAVAVLSAKMPVFGQTVG